MTNDWPFDQSPHASVVTLRQIADEGGPILHVTRGPGDEDWHFLGWDDHRPEDTTFVSLAEITKLDPSVLELAALPPGWHAWRMSREDAWTKEVNREIEAQKLRAAPSDYQGAGFGARFLCGLVIPILIFAGIQLALLRTVDGHAGLLILAVLLYGLPTILVLNFWVLFVSWKSKLGPYLGGILIPSLLAFVEVAITRNTWNSILLLALPASSFILYSIYVKAWRA